MSDDDASPRRAAPVEDLPPHQFTLGIVFLLATVFLWVGSSFLMSSIFRDQSYTSPWLITYICTASFSVYLIRPLVRYLLGGKPPFDAAHPRRIERKDSDDSSRGLYEGVPSGDRRSLSRTANRSSSRSGRESTQVESMMTIKEVSRLSALFVGIWFAANWTVNAALQYTSVSSVTILSSMSGFFTLGVGVIVGVEKFEILRIVSVVTSVAGVILVSKEDQRTSEELPAGSKPWLGDVLALSSAALYACYVLLMKVKVKHESRIDMQLFFGFVGLYNIVFLWPIGLILHHSGIESFRLPHTRALWVSVAVNAAITVVSDYLYMLAMLKTSPLIVTLGLSLTLPIAVCGDLFKGEYVGPVALLGGCLVLGSFVLLSLVQRQPSP